MSVRPADCGYAIGSQRYFAVSILHLATTSYNDCRRLISLEGLPEELSLAIFEAILAKGKLTPRLLELFWKADHDTVRQRVTALRIQWVPPVLPTTRNLWLHERPGFY